METGAQEGGEEVNCRQTGEKEKSRSEGPPGESNDDSPGRIQTYYLVDSDRQPPCSLFKSCPALNSHQQM